VKASRPRRPASKSRKESDSQPEEAIVPYDLARNHGRDGELLRDFVVRGDHKRPEPKQIATKRWLIREEFFDEWLDDYVKHYALASEPTALSQKASELVEACKGVLATKEVKKKAQVDDLEKTSASEGDVYALRDALLAAVKELSTPKRRLGLGTGVAMNEDVKELLKLKSQVRLRAVVFKCLKGIWDSGVGGEVLSIALDAVKARLDRFKTLAGEGSDVIEAMAGQQWAKLEDLIGDIDNHLREEGVSRGGSRQHLGPVEGRRTKLVVERALTALGGRGTSRAVVEWIEQNPDELAQMSEARLNHHVRDGKKAPVWQTTVAKTLTLFKKAKRQAGQHQVYMLPNVEEEILPLEDAPAPAQKKREKRPALESEGTKQEAAKPAPKRQRKPKASASVADSAMAAEKPAGQSDVQTVVASDSMPTPRGTQKPTGESKSKKAKKTGDAEQDRIADAFDAAFSAAFA